MECVKAVLGMNGDVHQKLAEVLDELERMGARVPTFQVASLSEHEASTWLRSESRRLEQLARVSGDLHS